MNGNEIEFLFLKLGMGHFANKCLEWDTLLLCSGTIVTYFVLSPVKGKTVLVLDICFSCSDNTPKS